MRQNSLQIQKAKENGYVLRHLKYDMTALTHFKVNLVNFISTTGSTGADKLSTPTQLSLWGVKNESEISTGVCEILFDQFSIEVHCDLHMNNTLLFLPSGSPHRAVLPTGQKQEHIVMRTIHAFLPVQSIPYRTRLLCLELGEKGSNDPSFSKQQLHSRTGQSGFVLLSDTGQQAADSDTNRNLCISGRQAVKMLLPRSAEQRCLRETRFAEGSQVDAKFTWNHLSPDARTSVCACAMRVRDYRLIPYQH